MSDSMTCWDGATATVAFELWLKDLRPGVEYSNSYYFPSRKWTGSAIIIGGFTWNDEYPILEANSVVLEGGGTPSVSTLGGWMQGGGYGPAFSRSGCEPIIPSPQKWCW